MTVFPKKHSYDFKLTEFTCTILKCLKTYIRQIYFLKHDIITLKISFIEPLHDKTSDLDFASNEDPDQPVNPPTLISLHSPHEERYERSFATH